MMVRTCDQIKSKVASCKKTVQAVPHPETSPPVLWTGKMHSWTGKQMGYLIVIFGHLT